MGCGKVSYVLIYHPILRVRIPDFFGIWRGQKPPGQEVGTVCVRPHMCISVPDEIASSGMTSPPEPRSFSPEMLRFHRPMLNSLPREI